MVFRARRGTLTALSAALALAAAVFLFGGCSGSGKAVVGGGAVEKPQSPEGAAAEEGDPPAPAPVGVPAFDPGCETVIKTGNTGRREVALTIDDGWNRDDRILDLLQSYGIRCTVFVVGGRGVAEANPGWVARMDRMGFEVCTHTYDHYKLTDHPYDYVVEDIRKGQEVIAAVTGKTYPYMRPSGGSYNDTVIRACRDCSCYLVLWSNSLGDTDAGTTAERGASAVLSNLKNGDIILCHFGGHHTYETLKRVIPEALARGFRFVTLTELLAP